MKYTKYLPLALCLTLSSCGEKEVTTSSDEQKETVGAKAKQDGHQAIKDALKSQVNSITSDLMLKVPNYEDLPPAVYNIPESLEGRDLVQVSVRWPLVAKEDMYERVDIFSELPGDPTVISKAVSKGDELEYIESNYVMKSDGGGGYVLDNSRFVKRNFNIHLPGVGTSRLSDVKSKVLVKGTDEYLVAAKKVEKIRKEQEAKAEAEKREKEAKALASKQENIRRIKEVFSEGSVLLGDIILSKSPTKLEVNLVSQEMEAGEEVFIISITQNPDDSKFETTKSSYKGKITPEGDALKFLCMEAGERPKGVYSHNVFYFLQYKNRTITLKPTDHKDRVVFEAVKVNSDQIEYKGELIRK